MRRGDRWWVYAIGLVMSASFAATHEAAWARILGVVGALGNGWVLVSAAWRGLRPAALAEPAPAGRPVEVDALDSGEWIFSGSLDQGTSEVELRVRGHRYLASFPEAEEAAFRAAMARLTAELDSGRSRVDVNAVFEQELGRKPFTDGGPVRPSLLRRVLREG